MGYGTRWYAADFETTTGKVCQDRTWVWSFCVDEVGKYKPEIYGSIDDFWTFCADQNRGKDKVIYFHNLRFDGEFILYDALENRGFRTGRKLDGTIKRPKEIGEHEIVYVISDMGQWYYICFYINGCKVEVRDSLKILPMTLRQIGKDICTIYKKTEMNYDDKSSLSDCSEKDIEYIENDVLVLSEAISFLQKANGEDSPFDVITALTIGSACLEQIKKTVFGDAKGIVGPDLKDAKIPKPNKTNVVAPKLKNARLQAKITQYRDQKSKKDNPGRSYDNQYEYVRKAYRGGYCYVNPRFQGQLLEQPGFTMDVSSEYPFVMCTEYSGSSYPLGRGKYETGAPREELSQDRFYYYVRFIASFKLKEGYVPTVQVKDSLRWPANLYLESSQFYSLTRKCYEGDYLKVELTMTKDDFELFLEHYDILSIEYLDHLWYYTATGIFDEYIKKYAAIKMNSEGAIRTLAKLFSNNSYGQMSKSDDSSFKIVRWTSPLGSECDIPDGEGLSYDIIEGHDKKTVNLAIGAAITAKARRYIITTIQNNIERFCYCDTDSVHCIGAPSDFVGPVDPVKYGAFKCESTWDRARFIRQKTYIESFDAEQQEHDMKKLKTDKDRQEYLNRKKYLNVCAAGMTPEQKQIFRDEYKFEDFALGLTIHGGKLKPRHVPGGIILDEVDFTII